MTNIEPTSDPFDHPLDEIHSATYTNADRIMTGEQYQRELERYNSRTPSPTLIEDYFQVDQRYNSRTTKYATPDLRYGFSKPAPVLTPESEELIRLALAPLEH